MSWDLLWFQKISIVVFTGTALASMVFSDVQKGHPKELRIMWLEAFVSLKDQLRPLAKKDHDFIEQPLRKK